MSLASELTTEVEEELEYIRRWEAHPPRPNAEQQREKKRQAMPDDPAMRFFRP